MSFLDEIKKQPRHIREIMFGLCVVTTIALVGMVWFRSFEENLFVLINPEQEKQDKFYADRKDRTPVIYANVTKALGNMRAALYGAFGFFEEYNSKETEVTETELKGEVHELPLSEDK